VSTADRYRRFADLEARGESPCFEAWALGVAGDAEVVALLDTLPTAKRQPNLVFAAARYVGTSAGTYADLRETLTSRWAAVRDVILTHRTQTNEVGRCAILLPLLAALPQPLALLEVGASAGLCLYPDRYSYRYDDRPMLGSSPVVIDCVTTGDVPVPAALPEVVWRAGIDVNPLDVRDADTARWLETLVWPEHDVRRTRLGAALAVVRAEPPRIRRGDLNEEVAGLAAEAPADATLVIFHSAVLNYLEPDARERFRTTVLGLDARWIANEGTGTDGMFLVSVDGTPVAHAAPHGHTLHWH
jgi:hypothetical protein